jgi:hypothetical protein
MTWQARPDQIEDLAHLMRHPRDFVLHDPGVGKTIVMALYSYYAATVLNYRTALVQPKSLMEKNREEFLKFTHFDEKDVVIVSGLTPKKRDEAMRSDARVFLFGGDGFAKEGETLIKYHPDVKVSLLDEPHLYFSGHNSKRTQAWYRLSRYMHTNVPFTGTIINGKLDSIYPFLHANFPNYYGTHDQFLNMHAERDEFGTLIHWKNHDRLRLILEKHSICRSFESVYGADATVIVTEPCEMHPAQREKYDELEAFALIELEDSFIEAGNPGVKAIRARQVLNHPVELGVLPIGTLTGKDEHLLVHIEEAIFNNERLTIFASMIPEHERIAAMIQKLGKTVGIINGNTPDKLRQQYDKDFREGRLQFIVGSPQCMSVGFNWGFLRKIVFASIDYQDSNFIQAYRRGVRGKRDVPLLVYVLEYRKSIEQRIFQIVNRKSQDAQKITSHKKVLTLGRALAELKEPTTLSMETLL